MKKFVSAWVRTSLILKIFIGIVLGICFGLFVPKAAFIGVLGTIFIGALKAIAPILVALLIMSSVAKAGEGIGARFRTVIILYMLTTLLAAVLAVFACELFPVKVTLAEAATDTAPTGLLEVFETLFTNMVANPISAVSNGVYIGVLFWAVVIGLAIKKACSIETKNFMSDIANAVSLTVSWIIQLAPVGIFGIVFDIVSENGLEVFTSYGQLLLVLVGTMLVCSLIVNPFIVFLLLKKNPYALVFRCLKESGLSAFFTRSSAANIPMNMVLCEKLGLDKEFYSVSIPLGSTINMDGAAVTITVMSLVAANTMGIEVSIPAAIILSIISTLGACGASGVAGGSLLLIPMACSLLGVHEDVAMQMVAIGFVIGVIQDSVETALNSSGDAIFTATAEYYDRKRHGQDMKYLGEFAKKEK